MAVAEKVADAQVSVVTLALLVLVLVPLLSFLQAIKKATVAITAAMGTKIVRFILLGFNAESGYHNGVRAKIVLGLVLSWCFVVNNRFSGVNK